MQVFTLQKSSLKKISAKKLCWSLAPLVLWLGTAFKGRLLYLLPARGRVLCSSASVPGLVTAHPESDADPRAWPALSLWTCPRIMRLLVILVTIMDQLSWRWPYILASALSGPYHPVAIGWSCFAEPCVLLLLSGTQSNKVSFISGDRNCLPLPKQVIRFILLEKLSEKLRGLVRGEHV